LAQSSIVGRNREVSRLAQAIEGVAEGHGSVWFLTGEAGIGKTRLAEEVARLARDQGMRTFWGRCWEAGGAPAYWPWVQVLRAVLRTAEPGLMDPYLSTLAQVLPELPKAQTTPDAADLAPDQARFQLMDAVSNVLADAAQRFPLVVVLEDLHVADVSTIHLLEFLSATVRHQPLLIVGTFREVELANAPAGPQLIRTAPQGERLSLERLTEEDVVSFLEATGEQADAGLVTELYRTTDGHPLFLAEVARLWRAQGSTTRSAIPPSVRTAIRERLATVTPTCMQSLRRGAVVGREFDIGLLEACYEDDAGDYVEGCQEATDAAILVEIAPQRYRFVHFLIRQLVYDAIPEDDRLGAHARLAQLLERRPRSTEPRWSEIAHHLVAAQRCREAFDAYRKAGAQALQQLAFEEAVQAYQNATRAADTAGDIEARTRVELLLELGHAQTRAGEVAPGKKTCAAAAELARTLGDATLLARAALEHGTALIYGRVDRELVELLEEALEALPAADGVLRARVMARLAAALQPAEDPEGPIEIARDAIAMARRLGDREALLDTLRNGGSAMVDLGDLQERIDLDREHAVLAEELGNPVEALRGNLRSIMDYLQLGRLDDAFRAMRACDSITKDLNHPAYRWRPIALRVLRATWEGDFDEAERLAEEVRLLGERAADPNAGVAHAMQKTRLLRMRGDFDAQLPWLAEVDRHWGSSEIARMNARFIIGAEHVAAGRVTLGVRMGFDAEAGRKILRHGAHTLQLSFVRLCVAAEDRELAEQLYRHLLVTKDHLVTGGMLYLTIEGPTTWGLASIARYLERNEDAREHYEQAIAMSRRTGGRPVHALISCEYAQMLSESDATEDRQRALALAENARSTADELGMRALSTEAAKLCEQLQARGEEQSPPPADTTHFTMSQVGDSWVIRYGNVDFHLKDMRGVRLLAMLVAEPGREFHVLDLSGGSRVAAVPVDRGDAGEVLDEEARRQYRARVVDLKEELTEAEDWNDPARVERARHELELIEQELSPALGIGGRERRVGSATERARVNVQRRIRDAIRRIENHHPGLAKHLDRSVRTGTYCAYEP
jgi:tetratricopeptide (TPR) repeat protein